MTVTLNTLKVKVNVAELVLPVLVEGDHVLEVLQQLRDSTILNYAIYACLL